MTDDLDLLDADIDAALDAVDLARITEPDEGSSGAPACIVDEPDITRRELAEIQRELALVLASMRSARPEMRA